MNQQDHQHVDRLLQIDQALQAGTLHELEQAFDLEDNIISQTSGGAAWVKQTKSLSSETKKTSPC